MNAGGTSTGSLIVATIRDIHVSSTGDTIFATEAVGINHPVAYYKPVNTTNLWTPFTVSGFPFIAGKRGYAITRGWIHSIVQLTTRFIICRRVQEAGLLDTPTQTAQGSISSILMNSWRELPPDFTDIMETRQHLLKSSMKHQQNMRLAKISQIHLTLQL